MEAFTTTITTRELTDCLGGITVQGVHKALKTHNIETIKSKNRKKIIPPMGIRKLLEERGFRYPKNIISFQIIKGGAGKTSLSFSLAVRASHYGAKVLAIDLDMQGNLTRSFKMHEQARSKPIWINLLRDNINVKDSIIRISDNLDFIPSNLNNSRLDTELNVLSTNLRDHIRNILSSVSDNYDLIIIDCSPSLTKMNVAITCSSDIVIIPVNPDRFSMDGLELTIKEFNRLKKEFNLGFDYRILWNKYDQRKRLAPILIQELDMREDLLNKILPVVCRIDASLENASYDEISIFDLPKKAPIRDDIDLFTKEILGINTWKELKNDPNNQ